MLLDLLRLVQLKQNMELYAEQQSSFLLHHDHQQRQNRQTTSGLNSTIDQLSAPNPNPNARSSTKTSSNSMFQQRTNPKHHKINHLQLLQGQQTQATVHPQCKPLDLSVKSSTQSADIKQRLSSNSSNRCQQNRPPPIDLSPQNSLSRDKLQDQSESKCSGQNSRPNELISSTTSPSSTSHSASSISLADSRCNEVISSTACSSSFPESNDNFISNNKKNGSIKTTKSTSNRSNTSSSLRRQKHKGAKSHLCNQCGRSFSRSDMLTRHSRLHSGLKPYQCGKCKQVFSRSDHLSTHERTHTGEKPYQCQFCAYSACRRDMITRHMRTHNAATTANGQRKKTSPAKNRRKRQREVGMDLNVEMAGTGKEGEDNDDNVVKDMRTDLLTNRANRNGGLIETDDISSSCESELYSITETV